MTSKSTNNIIYIPLNELQNNIPRNSQEFLQFYLRPKRMTANNYITWQLELSVVKGTWPRAPAQPALGGSLVGLFVFSHFFI